mmetsp:Transcript_123230/g.213709  ORF Transcript_123230/g.213709 Transcript_123230/m.213709 type:complete len:258 (+) Transcript_123230:206-979(+)
MRAAGPAAPVGAEPRWRTSTQAQTMAGEGQGEGATTSGQVIGGTTPLVRTTARRRNSNGKSTPWTITGTIHPMNCAVAVRMVNRCSAGGSGPWTLMTRRRPLRMCRRNTRLGPHRKTRPATGRALACPCPPTLRNGMGIWTTTTEATCGTTLVDRWRRGVFGWSSLGPRTWKPRVADGTSNGPFSPVSASEGRPGKPAPSRPTPRLSGTRPSASSCLRRDRSPYTLRCVRGERGHAPSAGARLTCYACRGPLPSTTT